MGGAGTRQPVTNGGNGSVQTVLVADRGRAFAEALAGLLRDAGLQAAASAHDQAAQACRFLQPTVVLLDGDAPVEEAIGIADAARAARSDVRILLLVAGDGRTRAAADLGADGVVSRHSELADVVAVVRGEPARAPTVRPRTGTRARQNGDAVDRLTRREVQVLRALMAGAPSGTIADHLGISPHTVRTHIQNIFAKLAVSTRLEAASLAREGGLRPLSFDEADEAAAGRPR